ncbi:MAG: hypothetical protein VX346_17765 [Planctomycetota bacterium]|nr:hypothetical protein [Planctomycetota bacterium]
MDSHLWLLRVGVNFLVSGGRHTRLAICWESCVLGGVDCWFGSGEKLGYAFGKYDASVAPFKPRHQVDLARRPICGTPRYPDVVGMAKLAFGVVARQLVDGENELLFRVLNGVPRFATERQHGQCAVDLNRLRTVFEIKEDTPTKSTYGGQARLVERGVRPDDEESIRQQGGVRLVFRPGPLRLQGNG